jgi:hypothetical protein
MFVMRVPYTVVCDLLGYSIFPYYLIIGTNFELKKIIENKMSFDFLYNFLLRFI